VNYIIAQKYVEALKELAASPNQKVFMLPVEASGILGALGGIAEVAREAMLKQPSVTGAPNRPPAPRAGA
jgi:hypothetical protein